MRAEFTSELACGVCRGQSLLFVTVYGLGVLAQQHHDAFRATMRDALVAILGIVTAPDARCGALHACRRLCLQLSMKLWSVMLGLRAELVGTPSQVLHTSATHRACVS